MKHRLTSFLEMHDAGNGNARPRPQERQGWVTERDLIDAGADMSTPGNGARCVGIVLVVVAVVAVIALTLVGVGMLVGR